MNRLLFIAASLALSTVHAQQPKVYQGILQQQAMMQQQQQAAEAQRQQEEQEAKQRQQMLMNAMQGLMGGAGNTGGAGAGTAAATSGAGSQPSASGSGSIGAAAITQLQSCGTLPPQVERAKSEMMAFRKACSLADTGPNQKFAINDYSLAAGTPRMYMFDLSGTCKMTSVAFGSGQTRAKEGGTPQACAENSSNLTPPGFHLTSKHNGGKYQDHNSIGMDGLEGQNSTGRGVVMHATNNPGLGVTHGCTGISYADFPKVKEYLGYGALVYNNFDSSQLSPSCNTKAGMSHSSACRRDSGRGNETSTGVFTTPNYGQGNGGATAR